MITVYVLVSFYDENGIHKAGTFTQVKEEDFDPKYMQKIEGGSGDAYTKAETDALLEAKQDDLTAGTNIQISDQDVISATDTGDTVQITRNLTSGTQIANIKVNGSDNKLFAPAAGSQVSVDQIQGTGTKIATITIDEVDTDIYAPAGGGGGGVSADVIADEFDTEQHTVPSVYSQYDFVKYQGYKYYWSSSDNNTDEPSDYSSWTDAGTNIVTLDSWGSNVNGGQIFTYNNVYYINAGSSQQFIRPSDLPGSYPVATNKGDWSASSTDYVHYDVGDYCTYNDELYICTGATTGQSWDSTKWNKITVMSQISGGSGGSTITTFDLCDPSDDNIPMPFNTLAPDAANMANLIINSTNVTWSNFYAACEQGTVYIKDDENKLAQITYCDPANEIALFGIFQNNHFYVYELIYGGPGDWNCDCINYNN